VTLLESEMPAHSHNLMAQATNASKPSSVGNSFAKVTVGATPYLPPAGAVLAQMSDNAVTPAGGDQPHNNMMLYLTLNFCIALQGVFPPRT